MTEYASFLDLKRALCPECEGAGLVDDSVFCDPSSPLSRDDVRECPACKGSGRKEQGA